MLNEYPAAKLLENIDYEVIAFPERHRALETVLVRPAKHVKQNGTVVGGEKPPLIVYPHGKYTIDRTIYLPC
jgi:hypothetical protein